MKKLLLPIFFLSLFFQNLNAQLCNIPSPPTLICESAPVVCPLDGYCSTNDSAQGIFQQPTTFCGSIQNAHWIAFVAGTTDLDVELNVTNCGQTPSGIGLQAMVFSGCGMNNWTTVSNCIYQAFPNSVTMINMNGLVIGEKYFIMIDGFAGDICDFSFNVVNGATAASNGTFLSDAGPDVALSCDLSPVILDGSNSTFDPNATIEWRDFNNNVLGTDTTLAVNQAGIYYFIHTDTIDGCNSLDIVNVTPNGFTLNLPEAAPLACDGPMIIPTGNIPQGPQYGYLWSTVNGNLLTGSTTDSATINSEGTYYLEVTELATGCSQVDSILIYNFQDGFTQNGSQTLTCNFGSSFINSVVVGAGLNNLTWNWTTADGQISGSANTSTPLISSSGTYTYSVSDDTGCNATGTVVVVDNAGAPIINIAPVDNLSCINAAVILDASGSSPSNQLSYSWEFNGISLGINSIVTVSQAGVYQLTITDVVNGCSATQTVVISDDANIPTFTISSTNVELNCANNFTQTVSLNGATDPNIIYDWFGPNGFSGIGTDVEISGNYEGTFEVVATNTVNGCTSTESFVVTNNGFDMNVSVTAAGCDLADGTATVTSGLANPGYAWSTGGTTNSISGLAQGWYSVTLTDLDNNCSLHENFYIEEDISCKVVISGYVVNDPNITCTYDASMEGIECVMVKLEPLGIYTLTDTTGYFEFVVDDGSYTVEFIGSDFVNLLCPVPGSYDVVLDMNGTSSDTNHFFVARKDIDLCVSKFTGNARPGLSQFNCVDICNYGIETTTAFVTFVHDSIFSDVPPLPNISPINANAATYMYDAATNTFSWELVDLQPGECRKIMWYMEVPVTAQIGDIISSEAKVNPILNDDNPDNNCLSWVQAVTGSFDPNDKRNMIGETQWGGEIYEDDMTMEYALRFQNVGNDTAFTVVIRDTLDDMYLNVESIRAITASHPMQVEFEDRNVLIFRFENILLVDSMTNEPASNGWVSFKIDRFDNIPFGTEIKNQAHIYFDFNAPVITNELVNTLTEVVSIFSPTKNQIQVEVIPNITNDLLTVSLVLEKTSPLQLQLFNAEGIVVQDFNFGKKQNGEHQFELNLQDLPAGIYFILIKTEEGSAVKRVIKM